MRSPNPKTSKSAILPEGLPKCPTGIHGLDEITLGGLPRGRPTLVCGGAGCGKTLLGMEFLVRGATEFDEPGVCLSFEETDDELASNVASLGFNLAPLIARKKLVIDHIYLERGLIEETGEYDLEALFVRLGHAVDSIGAKRVLLDSVEALFAGLDNESVLRSELRRLFRWLKERKLTAIVTGERGQNTLTRHGLEEYISDCVIVLDHQVTETVLTRRLRVVKYRGSTHGMNEYPFLIESDGISVLPVTSMELKQAACGERVSTGVPALDTMFGGKGYFRGSSILVSGTSGTGKTSLAAHFVDAACARGEACVFFSFEESAEPDRAQHAVYRNRFGALGGQGPAALSYGSADDVWPGNASCQNPQDHKGDRSPHRGGGPAYRIAARRHRIGDQERTAAPDRFFKRKRDHGPLDNLDQRIERPGTNGGRRLIPGGRVDAAPRYRERRGAESWPLHP